MRCVILAAGYATRLYPLTKNFPKPLLPVGGKPILNWLLEDLAQTGKITSCALVSNHRYAESFRAWAGGLSLPFAVTVLDDGTDANENRLGAVRDASLGMKALRPGDALVMAGDNVLDFSLAPFLDYFLKKGHSAILRYEEKDSEKLKKCGVIRLGADDRVLEMREKPRNPASNWCVPPFYLFTREDALRMDEALSAGCGADAPGSYIQWLAERAEVYALRMPGRRYDVGNLESYTAIRDSYRGIGEGRA